MQGFVPKNREDVDDFIVDEESKTPNYSTIDKYHESLYGGKSPLIKSMIQVESTNDPYTINKRTQAAGLIQITEDTAKTPGYGVKGITQYERYNPKSNV